MSYQDTREEFKSSAAQIEEAQMGVEIKMLKAINAQFAENQRHLSTARRRWATMLSDRRYAAAGYVGDPDENLTNGQKKLREMQAMFYKVANIPEEDPFKDVPLS
jgi:hypothetical protein